MDRLTQAVLGLNPCHLAALELWSTDPEGLQRGCRHLNTWLSQARWQLPGQGPCCSLMRHWEPWSFTEAAGTLC